MTTIDFLKKVYKQLDSQEYRLAFSPAKSNNWGGARNLDLKVQAL